MITFSTKVNFAKTLKNTKLSTETIIRTKGHDREIGLKKMKKNGIQFEISSISMCDVLLFLFSVLKHGKKYVRLTVNDFIFILLLIEI